MRSCAPNSIHSMQVKANYYHNIFGPIMYAQCPHSEYVHEHHQETIAKTSCMRGLKHNLGHALYN